jgi:hypothetical protein
VARADDERTVVGKHALMALYRELDQLGRTKVPLRDISAETVFGEGVLTGADSAFA